MLRSEARVLVQMPLQLPVAAVDVVDGCPPEVHAPGAVEVLLPISCVTTNTQHLDRLGQLSGFDRVCMGSRRRARTECHRR